MMAIIDVSFILIAVSKDSWSFEYHEPDEPIILQQIVLFDDEHGRWYATYDAYNVDMLTMNTMIIDWR